MKYLVIPGLLTDSLDDVKEKIRLVDGVVPRVSIDVIDGRFADNITVSVEDLKEIVWGKTVFDVQLMVEEPVDYLDEASEAGATRVFGHIERMGNREQFLEIGSKYSFEIGWALDLYTPVEELEDNEFKGVSGILLMSVKAGFSGQEYKDVSGKIVELRKRGFEGDIVVDGGMNEETIKSVLKAGANQFSVTNAIWKAKEPVAEWQRLMKLVKKET